MTKKPDGLWQYAVRTYAQPGVRDACLAIQDRHGANVCLLLAVSWLAALDRQCTAASLRVLTSCTEPWEDALRSLRAARRTLHQQSEPLYEGTKQLELAVEQQLLLALEVCIDPASLPQRPPPQALEENLTAVADYYGIAATDADWQRLQRTIEVSGLDVP